MIAYSVFPFLNEPRDNSVDGFLLAALQYPLAPGRTGFKTYLTAARSGPPS